MKKRIFLSSILTIALCLSLIVGSTFALFTSQTNINIAVTSGKVEMFAMIDNLQTWSLEDSQDAVGRTDGSFTQGGSAVFQGSTLTLDKIIPGDKVSFDLVGTNESNVAILYRVKIACVEGYELMQGLRVTVDGTEYTALSQYTSAWKSLAAETDMSPVTVSIELPKDAGNRYQDLSTSISVTVEAVQGNAEVDGEEEAVCFDLWDGTLDEEGLLANTDTANRTLSIQTSEQLAAFAKSVNQGNTYSGYTVTLENSLYLNQKPWTPIGPNADDSSKVFKGVFDGQNQTIYDLNVSQEPGYHAAGLFGALNGTLKNLVIDGASISSLCTGSGSDNGTAVVAGSLYPSGTVDAVTVRNATVFTNRYAGGIVGYAYGNITNCKVENSTISAGMDHFGGNLDNGDKVGGIVGYMESERSYVLNHNTVTGCQLIAARDVAGVVGVIGGVKEMEYNTVSDTQIFYTLEKDYGAAAEIATQRKAVTISATNTANQVSITKREGTLVSDATAMVTALKDGLNVVLAGDITTVASEKNGYGHATVINLKGQTLDGNGNVLSAIGANSGYGSVIYTTGGTIRNLEIRDAFRCVFSAGLSQDLIFENVLIEGSAYTFNSDGADPYAVIFKNSTLNGWTSYTGGYASVSFDGCTFGSNGSYAYMRPYSATTMTNCVFEEGFEFDARMTSVIFENCYVGNTLITEENLTQLLGDHAAGVTIR